MNKQTKQLLQNYENNVIEITKVFCKKYFGDCYEYSDNDWAGGDIGGIISINDYFFSFSDILNALKYKATKKELFGFYDYCLEKHLKDESTPSFENYLKYFRGFSFKEIEKKLNNKGKNEKNTKRTN